MPTKRQLSKMREAEIEYPQIRREPIDVKPNNMNEQLNAAKDQAAREFNLPDFEQVKGLYFEEEIGDERFDMILNRAMEIYAEMVLKSRKKKSKINPYEPTGFKAINSKTTKP